MSPGHHDLFGGPGAADPGWPLDPELWRRTAFGGDVSDVDLRRQIEAVDREIGFRRLCYPRWIREGRISYDGAVEQVRAMRAVLQSLLRLERLAERDRRMAEERGLER
jgi:hypothetical protein